MKDLHLQTTITSTVVTCQYKQRHRNLVCYCMQALAVGTVPVLELILDIQTKKE